MEFSRGTWKILRIIYIFISDGSNDFTSIHIYVHTYHIVGVQQEWHQEDDGIGSPRPSFPHGDMNLIATNQQNASVRNPETSTCTYASWVWIPDTLYSVFPSLFSLAQCSMIYLGGNL